VRSVKVSDATIINLQEHAYNHSENVLLKDTVVILSLTKLLENLFNCLFISTSVPGPLRKHLYFPEIKSQSTENS
jgi:hypothetical protein